MKENLNKTIIRDAICVCLENGVPFCIYMEPGAKGNPVFYSNPGLEKNGNKDEYFFIGQWNGNNDVIKIYNELDALMTLNMMYPTVNHVSTIKPFKTSTVKDNYISKVNEVKNRIRSGEAQKVVISKVKSIGVKFGYEGWADVAAELFKENVSAFRFIYFTPETGAWMGASPELLLETDINSGRFMTMALAGTRGSRVHGVNDPWPEKDKKEHKYVADYIEDILKQNGIKYSKSTPHTFVTGDLQHIKTEFDGTLGEEHVKDKFSKLLFCLNPTPALCGYPREAAMKIIAETECHNRHCYGGFVGVSCKEKIAAYVNLRNVNFDAEGGCLYGGGGIVEDSEPEAEWDEAESKMNVIGKHITLVEKRIKNK